MKLKNICLSVLLAIVGQNVFAADENVADGVSYKNTRGSILKLQINEDSTLTGWFTTAVATKECQKAVGMKRPITGYIENNALTFSVSYPGCGVVTFIGKMENGQKVIDTTAMIAHSSALSGKSGMEASMISHDVFNQI